MKGMSELTAEQVRREIAERTGYTIETYDHVNFGDSFKVGYRLTDPEGRPTRPYYEHTVDDAWLNTPSWTSDDGAAIRLAFDVTDRLNVNLPRWWAWTFEYKLNGLMLILDNEDDLTIKEIIVDGRDALALSRLALLALRELEGKGDE